MVKGEITTIKMRLTPNLQSVDIDYVLKSLLDLSKKTEKTDLVPAAKQILDMSSRRGADGLHSENWRENIKKLQISQSQYFYVLNILKSAGLIYKSKGRFYICHTFSKHIAKIASATNNFLMDKGAL